MTDFATITGQIFEDYGAPVDQRVPWSSSVRFTPVALDESHAIVNSNRTILAQADRDGIIHLNGGPVELWAGRWKITLPDGESFEADLKAGETYDLTALRGFVPAPGQVVQTVKLDGVRAVALPAGAEPTATVEAGVLALGIPAAGGGGAVEDTGWVDLFATGGALLMEEQLFNSEYSPLYARRVGALVQLVGSANVFEPRLDERFESYHYFARITDPRFIMGEIPRVTSLDFPSTDWSNLGLSVGSQVMPSETEVLVAVVAMGAANPTFAQVGSVTVNAMYFGA